MQMRKEHNVVKFPLEKDAFGVNISPYTDYAFIATLIAILHEISQESTRLKEELSEEVVSQMVEELVSS